MSGTTGTNHPDGRRPIVKARQLPCRLGLRPSEGWTAAAMPEAMSGGRPPLGGVVVGLDSGVRVVPRPERPLGSRVREIRMHGLNGGPTCNRPVLRFGHG